jgi:hypothetical protein
VVFFWITLNLDFFHQVLHKRSFCFLLKSVLWTYVDHLIYGSGIIKGSFQFARRG